MASTFWTRSSAAGGHYFLSRSIVQLQKASSCSRTARRPSTERSDGAALFPTPSGTDAVWTHDRSLGSTARRISCIYGAFSCSFAKRRTRTAELVKKQDACLFDHKILWLFKTHSLQRASKVQSRMKNCLLSKAWRK